MRALTQACGDTRARVLLVPAWHTCPGGRHERRLAHGLARARRPRGPPGCKGSVLVRAPVAPGSAVALTGWSPRCGAAALVRRHADGRGERRSPLVLPRHAASRALPGSSTVFRP